MAGGGFSSCGFFSQMLVVLHSVEGGDMGHEKKSESNHKKGQRRSSDSGALCSTSWPWCQEEERKQRFKRRERVVKSRISKWVEGISQ